MWCRSLLLVGFSWAPPSARTPSTRERFKSYFTKNPLIWATAAALLAPESLSPQWAVDATRVLVYAILPSGFFAVGIVVRHESELDKLSFPPQPDARRSLATVLMLSLRGLGLPAADRHVGSRRSRRPTCSRR